MKKLILILLLSLPLAAFCQQPDCFKFREGRFRTADTRAGVITIVERHGSYETQTSESLKAIVRFRINWLDNCSYTLTLDKVIRNENKIDFPPGLTISMKIISATGNACSQEISSSMGNGVYTVETVKLN